MRKVIVSLAGFVLATSLTASAWACNTAGGEVTKIDAKGNTLVMNKTCTGGAEQMKFTIKKDTKVTVNGKEAQLADLKAGDKVTIDYEKTDDVLAIRVVRDS